MQQRYIDATNKFAALYGGGRETARFSVPGRSEILGNHTDHNHGCVIAAAVDLDIIAVASRSEGNRIRIKSEGFEEDIVEIGTNNVEKFTSAALIAGVCDGFIKRGCNVGGFDAYTTSDVLKGSGLSSSAAFEVMVGTILNHLYNGGNIPAVEIAKIGQYAENVFFGKPCGLMDQIACAVGGFVAIDFADEPIIEKLDFDLNAFGYKMCIVNTGGSHADLNEDYASIPGEMKKVAAYFGKKFLREVEPCDIMNNIPKLREYAGDRAMLRAIHFCEENERVEKAKHCTLPEFLQLINASGNSSYKKLQNIYSVKDVNEQGLAIALALCESILDPKTTAHRVHGGGFAGTIQVFLPSDDVERFKTVIENVFGAGSCLTLNTRNYGAVYET
ncbi:MAG: galactokinase [Oscillospiraceae bacterium]|nr:galactokinase [Oscillospiraceae bacterium]